MKKLVLLFSLTACTTYSNLPIISSVLAVTQKGDTITIPINQIRPTQIYNVVGYDFYPSYFRRNTYDRDFRFYHYNYNSPTSYGSSHTIRNYGNPSSFLGGNNSGINSGGVTSGKDKAGTGKGIIEWK